MLVADEDKNISEYWCNYCLGYTRFNSMKTPNGFV